MNNFAIGTSGSDAYQRRPQKHGTSASEHPDVLDFPIPAEWNLLAHVRQDLDGLDVSARLRKRTESILDSLQIILSVFAKVGSVDFCPRPHLSVHEDGSIALEFIRKDIRLSFNIEVEESESSWCLVSSDEKGLSQCTGNLKTSFVPNAFWLMSYFLLDETLNSGG